MVSGPWSPGTLGHRDRRQERKQGGLCIELEVRCYFRQRPSQSQGQETEQKKLAVLCAQSGHVIVDFASPQRICSIMSLLALFQLNFQCFKPPDFKLFMTKQLTDPSEP